MTPPGLDDRLAAPRVSEHHMLVSGRSRPMVQSREVLDVLGHQDPALLPRRLEEISITKTDELRQFLHRHDIMPMAAQPRRDLRRMHLVQQQLHHDSRRRSASQTANSRADASSLAAISASISSVNSA